MNIITLFVAFSGGTIFGVMIMCVLSIGKEADRHIEMGEEKR